MKTVDCVRWLTAAAVAAGAASAQTPTFTDPRDGQTYRTVKIGGQTWMAQNLNYKIGKSACYENKAKNCKRYGRLYSWDDAMEACPAGWHLPDTADWGTLIRYVDPNAAGDSRNNAGRKLKSARVGYWYYNNGTDEYGFSALPGGYGSYYDFDDGRGRRLKFDRAEYHGDWWSATECDDMTFGGWTMYISYDEDYATFKKWFAQNPMYSVRCVRDA